MLDHSVSELAISSLTALDAAEKIWNESKLDPNIARSKLSNGMFYTVYIYS